MAKVLAAYGGFGSRGMTDQYDLMVIGSGVAGNKVAERCAGRGWKVAISENRELGGTCGLRGCNPKKLLTSTVSVVDHVHRMRGKGLTQGTEVVWEELMRFKREFTDHIPVDRESSYHELGVDVLRGNTRFVSPLSVDVGGETVSAKRFLVATGSRPQTLGVAGEQLMITSDQFLELEHLPRRVLFVGGGYISFEFGQVASIAGSDVTLITRGQRVLGEFDRTLSERMLDLFQQIGIRVFTRAPLESMTRTENGILVEAGLALPIEVDMVVHGAGRVPQTDGLDLDAASVLHDKRGIHVDPQMRSVSNPDVFAAGDVVAGGMPLSQAADHEAYVVSENLLNDGGMEVNYEGIPTVVFTSPPIASVGLNEEDCTGLCIKYKVRKGDLTRTHSSRRVMTRHSEFKVLIEEGTDRILGAHIMGSRAEEVINIFGMAIRHGITARAIKSMPFAFPTEVYDSRYMV